MKKQIAGLIILLLLGLTLETPCYGRDPGSSKKIVEVTDFLPMDGDVPGWRQSGEMLKALNPGELYNHIDGGAGLYIGHGFRAYAGQIYKGSNEVEIELAIYDQGSAKDARELYHDPLMKPDRSKTLENLGEEARLDERELFCHVVEFIQGRFFIRVIIQDRSEEGLNTGLLFAHYVAKKIR